MESTEQWFAVHLGRSSNPPHAGFLKISHSRDTNSRRVVEQLVSIHGRLDKRAIDTDARCRLVLTRRQGRLVPLEVDYADGQIATQLRFAQGRIQATGSAAGQSGDAVPDDIMPTFGVFALASGIFNQPEASVTFTPLTEMTGRPGTAGSKLVCSGLTSQTPFPSATPLWEVLWFTTEGTRVQAFYFDNEGGLVQADWGGSRARRVATEAEAKPAPKVSRSGRQKKVAG